MSKKFLNDEMTDRGENRFENLMEQVKEVFSSDYNDNNIRTNEKYYTAMSTFTKYVGEYTGISKMSNVESKHIYGFAEKMQGLGMSDSTLKGYMAGIRDFYDMGKEVWDKCKTVVPDNAKLGLDERINGNVERAWSQSEISEAKALAVAEDRMDVYHAINIAENFGTRLDGTCSLTLNQIDKALETRDLHVVEKGGKPRDIPVSAEGRQALQEAKAWGENRDISRNGIFCQDTDIKGAKKGIQDWIYHNRDSFQDSSRVPSWEARENYRESGAVEKGDLTFHGIRHSWASEKYGELMDQGYSEEKARLQVSAWLGHNRDEVTKVYLARA